jgi:hypothetical protein
MRLGWTAAQGGLHKDLDLGMGMGMGLDGTEFCIAAGVLRRDLLLLFPFNTTLRANMGRLRCTS